VLAAVLASGGSKPAPQAPPRTVIRTVTGPGQTVTQPAPTTTATASTAPPATSSASGSQLNAAGYAKLQAGDLKGALPLLEQAVQKLNGTGAIDEAYAKYNLAYTRFALGDCTDVLSLLDQAQAIEGKKKPIDDLRHQAKKGCKG
jgi:tetratricopeptide (TPR) repeat protein